MAKITIEELSGSLKEYLNGLGLTEAQVQDLIDKMQEEVIGNKSELATTDKSSLVAAINELFQSANNGKELIASAIGEPLNAEDTFSAMSSDINSLLSTFKTNMMNNGITVESSDRFKSLIDKIATMVEEGEGKGIQYITGSLTTSIDGDGYATISVDTGFLPNILIGYVKSTSNSNYIIHSYLVYIPELLPNIVTVFQYQGDNFTSPDSSTCDNLTINNTKLTMKNVPMYQNYNESKYYAIGVGEEDTTLRDSLASILEEEGVTVTEEDDMASLIGKVDSEFTKDNNTISGLENEINNGKSIIANAIGEPLSATDTFTAMGDEIEEILEYFRDKLRSIGVTDSLDNLKLKGLIDKVRGITKYSITKNLTNCTINNDATIIEENSSYNATITANSNYIMKSITVTMGGVDVTNDVVSNYNINITSVTGDIVISADAEVNNPYPPGTNVNNTVSSFSAYKYNPVTKSIPVEADGKYTLSFNYGPNISNQGYTASVSVRVCDADGNTVTSDNKSTTYGSTSYSKNLTLKKGYTVEITASISVTTNNAHCNQVSSIQLIFNSL